MSKNAQWMGLTLACALASSAAWAQGPAGAGAPQAPAAAQPPAMVAGQPISALAAPTQALPAPQESSAMSRKETLRKINDNKARLELLKSQAELDKFEKPSGADGAPIKDDASGLQAALEQAKKEQAPLLSAAPAEQAPQVTLLATFSMVSSPQSGYAEIKVGDLIVHKKVGDRLPSGDYVRAIDFDSIELAKSKNAKKTRTVYISASDTATVYGSRGRSGQSIEASSAPLASPSGLPPMPGSR